MRILFVFLLVMHAAIHVAGFIKAYNLAKTPLPGNISKAAGNCWLIAALLLFTAAGLFIAGKSTWWMPGAIGLVLSQALILGTWSLAKAGTMPNLILLLVLVPSAGYYFFSGVWLTDVETQLRQEKNVDTSIITTADLETLPDPVKKYLVISGCAGKPRVHNFVVSFKGRIRKSGSEDWIPFESIQYNFLPPGYRLFFMNATMKHLPVAGYHAYKNGKASMDIRLLSLFTVEHQSGSQMDEAETVTFFNDMCCMAPASLLDKRIKWLKTENNAVQASFTQNNITVLAWLYFNEDGKLINFTSGNRYALENDHTMKQLPWSTPIEKYKLFHGYKLPSYAKTIYTYSSGNFCYGEFETVDVRYNVKE